MTVVRVEVERVNEVADDWFAVDVGRERLKVWADEVGNNEAEAEVDEGRQESALEVGWALVKAFVDDNKIIQRKLLIEIKIGSCVLMGCGASHRIFQNNGARTKRRVQFS